MDRRRKVMVEFFYLNDKIARKGEWDKKEDAVVLHIKEHERKHCKDI